MGTRTPVQKQPVGAARVVLEELRAALDRADRQLDPLGEADPNALRDADRARRAIARLVEAQRQLEHATAELHQAKRRMADAVRAWRDETDDVQRLLGEAAADPPARQGRVGPGMPVMSIPSKPAHGLPPIAIATFGRFEVRRDDAPIRLCASKSGQAILRYLATHPQRRESMDALMDLLWPGDSPKVARHKLHIAFSALRTSLAPGTGEAAPEMGYVRYADGAYELNPMAPISIDLEIFFTSYRAGQRAGMPASIPMFETACEVVTGPFLVEEMYSDWAIPRREAVTSAFRTMAHALAEHYATGSRLDDAAEWAARLLAENRTDEAAHRLLMRVHVRAGRRAEALRQYQVCVRALSDDLGIGPMAETTRLYQGILDGRADPDSALVERP